MTTHHEYRGYVFSISYQPRHPAYAVDFPDFRDIITSGDSLADAFSRACEALDLHLESMAKLKMRPPEPRHRLVLETGTSPAWIGPLHASWERTRHPFA